MRIYCAMGGCRCVFRDCKVNSARNPKMHFFKFPVREKERFLKWVEFSGYDTILDLSPSQQANRAVCGRHFRDECFMNYMKNRLCAKTVPTITRLGANIALDYESLDGDGLPQLVELQKPNLPHLIPPEGFACPLDFNDDVDRPEEFTFAARVAEKRTSTDNEDELSQTKRIKGRKNNIEINTELDAPMEKSPSLEPLDSFHIIHDSESILTTLIENDDMEQNIEISDLPVINQESSENIENLMKSHCELQNNYENLVSEHSQLQESYNELETKCAQLEQLVISLKEFKEKEKTIETNSAPQQTKHQLYAGAKKYLNASMATLLRMEMFGSTERAWMPDEQEIALELLQLGENVYKYFIDEWRFRLPALREVRSWANNES